MNSKEIIRADLLDILFENRNKQYGAYTLRKHYSARLTTALGITLSACLLLILLNNDRNSAAAFSIPDYTVRVIETTDLKPVQLEPKPVVRRTEPVAQASYARVTIVKNTDPLREMQSMRDINASAISGVNVEGPRIPEIHTVPPPVPGPAALGSGGGNTTPGFEPIEKAPEFPGGPEAWVKFLNRYLQVPEELEAGEKRTVLIQFMVDVDGSVTGMKVVRSGGQVFDNEVMRVLRKMPKWQPAIQNGRVVAVPFTQPVTFVADAQ
ncbi:MAG TPA: TonB family protein [Flavisolibacter sp.]